MEPLIFTVSLFFLVCIFIYINKLVVATIASLYTHAVACCTYGKEGLEIALVYTNLIAIVSWMQPIVVAVFWFTLMCSGSQSTVVFKEDFLA